MVRNTLTKKDLRDLRKAVGGSSWGNRSLFLLAVLVLLAIGTFSFLVTVGGADSKNFMPNDKGLIPLGSQAPNFSAETVDGGKVSLEDSGDYQATMLVFFATWCPHCQKEAPIISELESQYEDLGVVMVGIDNRDNSGKVREFVNRFRIESPTFYQPSLGSTYRVSGYPTIYVLDGSGEIVAAHSGEVPRDVLEGWIEQARESDG